MTREELNSYFKEQIRNHLEFIMKPVESGHNGPYNDKETVVRNLSHSILSISYFYRQTNNNDYKKLLVERANEILSKHHKLENGLYNIRLSEKKDKTNGVIGQAWVIEALVESYRATNQKKFIKEAIEIFHYVKFDNRQNVWFIESEDKKKIDRTLNHQLWFAMAGSLILDVYSDEKIRLRITSFLKSITKRIKVHQNGLIVHPLFLNDNKGKLIKLNYYLKSFMNFLIGSKNQKIKEAGYHLFNVYAIAIIKLQFHDWDLYKTNKFEKIISYSFSEELLDKLYQTSTSKINLYGYPYNAPAFELPIIYFTFKNQLSEDAKEILHRHLDNQISSTYSSETGLFDKNTNDIFTLNYRFYELLRFL